MDFKKVTLEDKEKIERFTKRENYFLASYCFVDMFIWQGHYNTEFSIENDFLYIRCKSSETGKFVYLFPIGNGDLKEAFENIKKDAEKNNQDIALCSIPESKKSDAEAFFQNEFCLKEDRSGEDYIYLAQSLITLKGKKLHSKRNFINRFKAEYDGRWSYESLREENIHEIFDFHLEWCGQKDCSSKDEFLGETCAVSKALKNYKALEIKGGVLRLDGKIIAFTLGSQSHSDMYTVHIEKASYEIPGAYQMINQLFAEENFQNVTYVDREEDLGIEGLRKAKMSYYPEKMGVCYCLSPIKP